MPALGAVATTTGQDETNRDMVQKTGPFVQNTPTPASYSTAGAQTYTVADVIGTIIVRNCNGGSRTDVLPTAALMVAALPNARIGDTFDCLIINGTNAANTVTITAGSGGALDTNQNAATAVIAQNSSKYISIRLTNVTIGSEAYVFYC